MLGRSHRFLGITSTFWGVNVPCSRTQHGLTRVGFEPPTSGSRVGGINHQATAFPSVTVNILMIIHRLNIKIVKCETFQSNKSIYIDYHNFINFCNITRILYNIKSNVLVYSVQVVYLQAIWENILHAITKMQGEYVFKFS